MEVYMGYHRLSVTIPDEVYARLKAFADARKMKMSHLVADAIRDKNRCLEEEAFIQRVNAVCEDPVVQAEQTAMAETIAESTALDELPW